MAMGQSSAQYGINNMPTYPCAILPRIPFSNNHNNNTNSFLPLARASVCQPRWILNHLALQLIAATRSSRSHSSVDGTIFISYNFIFLMLKQDMVARSQVTNYTSDKILCTGYDTLLDASHVFRIESALINCALKAQQKSWSGLG